MARPLEGIRVLDCTVWFQGRRNRPASPHDHGSSPWDRPGLGERGGCATYPLGNSLDGASAIGVDASGNVFVVGSTSNNAFKITPAGVVTEVFDGVVSGGGDLYSSLALDANGNLYLPNAKNSVFKVAPDGAVTDIVVSADIVPIITGPVAVDGSDNLFVGARQVGKVFKVAPGGVVTEVLDPTGDGNNTFSTPEAIAVDTSGNVYVTGVCSNNAFKIAPSGAISEIIDFFAEPGGGTLEFPGGIAVADGGDVYVSGVLTNNVFKITPGGDISEIIDFVQGAAGVAVHSNGKVYATGIFGSVVYEIAPDRVPALSPSPTVLLVAALAAFALTRVTRAPKDSGSGTISH